jgi:site-specific DNA-methyltransferase (adenine-specific)
MGFSGQFFRALGIDPGKRGAVSQLSSRLGVPVSRLRYYNDTNVLPSGDDLDRILQVCGISEVELMLAMGRLSRQILEALEAKAGVSRA